MFFKKKNEKVVAGLEQQVHLLEQELKEREIEIELFQDSAETVCRELNIQKVLQRVAQHAQKIISAETVLVPIVNEDSKTYTYRAAYGKNADEIIGETLPLEFGVCGWVWKNHKPWRQGTLDKPEDPEKTQHLSDGNNVVMVPMIGKDGFLGGLSGINKTNGKRFTERDLHLLSLFAAQASIAIENASNFHCLNQAVQLAELLQKETVELNQQLEQRVAERTEELLRLNKKLEHQALHDPLTGLPNRLLINDRMLHGIRTAARENKSLSVIVMDVDHFKHVNDTLGHQIGDELLKEVARRVQAVLRKSDTVGRMGGDEFVIILPGAEKPATATVIQKIKDALNPPFSIEGHKLTVCGSMGIACYPEHGYSELELLKHADMAMYAAKRSPESHSVFGVNNH